jgi:ABC-type bacteriocin/lantibiotic exporter with double-glycine peptidase domain
MRFHRCRAGAGQIPRRTDAERVRLARELTGAFVYLVSTLQPALQQFAQIAGSWLLQLKVTADHLASSCPTRPGVPKRRTGWREPVDGSVRIRELTFGYGRVSEPAVAGLDLDIAAGEPTYRSSCGT